MQDYSKFLIALNDAVRNNESKFICPLCGGTAIVKKLISKRLKVKCDGCGIDVKQL